MVDQHHKSMCTLYVFVGLDKAIAKGWLAAEHPFATEDGVAMIESWLESNAPPDDMVCIGILSYLAIKGSISLESGGLGGQKPIGVEDYLTLIRRAWEN